MLSNDDCRITYRRVEMGCEMPAYWKQTRLKVILKKGDAQLTENYRPIAVLPILYKVFGQIVCGRLRKTLYDAQSCDQAGFRLGFGCDDHLSAITLFAEKFSEVNRALWVVAVDFKKAFDTIDHASLWNALVEQRVPHVYISCLMKLYDRQVRVEQCNRLSKKFMIKRGTKQGDPISPILFNTTLEAIMRSLKKEWLFKKKGVKTGCEQGDYLTNLRFADDILLMGRSLKQVRCMLEDLEAEAKKSGLEIHLGKIKIMNNGIGSSQNIPGPATQFT